MALRLTLVHLSDTHNLHDQIDFSLSPLDPDPQKNILLHTGDFSNDGTPEEVRDFDRWLGGQERLFAHRVVIPGNHDWRHAIQKVCEGSLSASEALSSTFFSGQLPHATHVLSHNTIRIHDLTIHGCSWDPWHSSALPDDVSRHVPHKLLWEGYVATTLAAPIENSTSVATPDEIAARANLLHPNRYRLIPRDVDVVLTHGPPAGVLDCMEGTLRSWGSSVELVRAFHELGDSAPKVHLFGHIHEQRGMFVRDENGRLRGCVEYERAQEGPTPTREPLPNYPATFQVIANTAMANHCKLEGAPHPFIRGVPRVIVATRPRDATAFSFSVHPRATQ